MQVIKQLGRAKSAQIKAIDSRTKKPCEITVYRAQYEFLQVEGYPAQMVTLEDYAEHFIFKVPVYIQGPTWMCTCGSRAVHNLENNHMVCYEMATTNTHTNLKARWV